MNFSIQPSEYVPFDMYFATIVGMNNHPGMTREPVQKKSLDDCAGLALAMLQLRRTLIPTEKENE